MPRCPASRLWSRSWTARPQRSQRACRRARALVGARASRSCRASWRRGRQPCRASVGRLKRLRRQSPRSWTRSMRCTKSCASSRTTAIWRRVWISSQAWRRRTRPRWTRIASSEAERRLAGRRPQARSWRRTRRSCTRTWRGSQRSGRHGSSSSRARCRTSTPTSARREGVCGAPRLRRLWRRRPATGMQRRWLCERTSRGRRRSEPQPWTQSWRRWRRTARSGSGRCSSTTVW
mmetsp:Transcript_114038/g.317259  ORF Transcript_114038/g.317259 Transcript_114038/m.317259 type:complete len:234 (-) Transcript_114038:108-809(-)